MVAVKSRPREREQLKLRLKIDEILARPSAELRVDPDPPQAVPEPATTPVEALDDREPFGRWLIAQKDRGDWIDALANAARQDTRFPKNGSPDDVRKHLTKMGAEGDMFEALDDAEMDWLSL